LTKVKSGFSRRKTLRGYEKQAKGPPAMKSTVLLLSAVLLSGAFLLATAADDLTPATGKAACAQCDPAGLQP
jgi:hypothetical protein